VELVLDKLKQYKNEIMIAIVAALSIVVVGYTVNIGAAVFVLFLLLVILFAVTQQKGNKLTKNFGTHEVTQIKPMTFSEIGGGEHVKEELKEALDFLIHKDKMEAYGVRILKGILLTGPPGTGKTLLAKASAYYTDSYFIAASGSEFVEKYVGTGAQRVRELFNKAREEAKRLKKKNAIIFIDEIDVIGGKRDGGQMREYDQTLNQLLTEMDGIYDNQDVQIFIIAATNRKDMLDDALLRAGRFDRHIEVALPDKASRLEILKIHAKNKKISDNVDWDKIASETYQFSGAQLEALLNEAAIYAFREKADEITSYHIEQAIDKVLLGEQINRETSLEDKIRVARHEIGHAILAEMTNKGSVAQVVLAPRGGAMGYVRHNPSQDKYLYSKTELEHKVMVMLGGAVAEQIFYGERSTGSKGDFDQALQVVNTMIDSGLTEAGIIAVTQLDKKEYKHLVNVIMDELLLKTEKILLDKKEVFELALPILLENEQLNGEQFRKLLQH